MSKINKFKNMQLKLDAKLQLFFCFTTLCFCLTLIPNCVASNSVCLKNKDICRPHHWSLVFDAGSTKTRLYMYSFKVPETGTGAKTINLQSATLIGRISSLSDFPNAQTWPTLRTQVTNILRSVAENNTVNFDPICKPCTKVTVLATAGLRAASTGHQRGVLNAALDGIRHSGFSSIDKKTRVISGEDEALFDWIAINYAANGLKGFGTADAKYTIALDLGGGSTQVAVAPVPAWNSDSTKIKTLNLFDKKITLYVESYSDFGVMALKNKIRIKYPSTQCLASGYTTNYTFGGMTHKIGNVNQLAPSFSACEKEVMSLLKDIKPTSLSKMDAPIMAISAFYHVIVNSMRKRCQDNKESAIKQCNSLNSFPKKKSITFTMRYLQDQASYFCKNPPTDDSPFAPFYCMENVYIYKLLTHVYGLQPKERITMANWSPDSSYEISWAIGYALLDFNEQLNKH